MIGADGGQVGIIPTHEALRLAEEAGLELVEVNPRAAPPVCKIMDFGKFKYETSKKEKASRKHQSTIVLKEIKLRPKTDDHDFDFKVKHIRTFLSEGNKCKLVIVFRGREIVHPETGQAMLDKVVKSLGDTAMVEQRADDGRTPHGDDRRPPRRRHPHAQRAGSGPSAHAGDPGWRRRGSSERRRGSSERRGCSSERRGCSSEWRGRSSERRGRSPDPRLAGSLFVGIPLRGSHEL